MNSQFASGSNSPRIQTGRHFLQIPGPSNVPDRVLRAMDFPTIDHRVPEFDRLGRTFVSGNNPQLCIVNTSSSSASIDCRHGEWRVDVTVSCSQMGLMLPPGRGFNAISDKASAATKSNKFRRSYCIWDEILKS